MLLLQALMGLAFLLFTAVRAKSFLDATFLAYLITIATLFWMVVAVILAAVWSEARERQNRVFEEMKREEGEQP